jgi:hypothetical protein
MLWKRIKEIMFGCDPDSVRVVIILGSFGWAFLLWWPGDLFPTAEQIANGTGRTTYALMAGLMDEDHWADLFFLQACFASYNLLYKTRNAVTLTVDAMLGCALWSASTIACFLAYFKGWSTYQPPAAMASDVAIMAASWWYLVRHWAERPCCYPSCDICPIKDTCENKK